MEMTIPAALRSLASAGAAIQRLIAWRKAAQGDTRALLAEIEHNLIYLDMVAEDGVDLARVVDSLSTREYRRLARQGFDFDSLQRSRIAHHPSLAGTDLEPWIGKPTGALVDSIYRKIDELRIRYPLVGASGNYRWMVRVNNIRKRIWLLLRHVGAGQQE